MCIPIIAPPVPTKRSHPNVEACSTATRAAPLGGSTSFLYSGGCWSNSSQDGMLTTRTFSPAAVSCSYAATQSDTSLPVPIRISSGSPSPGSAST